MTTAPLPSRRVLGCGRGAALLRPEGTIDWWCPNSFDATPVLWALLAPAGGSAEWCETELASWDATPAATTARSVLRHEAGDIETWDGLIDHGDGTMLVRLARLVRSDQGADGSSNQTPSLLTHRLRCGGFDGPSASWHEHDESTDRSGAACEPTLGLRVTGSHVITGDGTILESQVPLARDWEGFAIACSGNEPLPDTAALVVAMGTAERADRERWSRHRRPRRHGTRAVDALRVLHALTDAATGAPVASVTTGVPEAPDGARRYDYRYTWLRDSAYACATAALLGQPTTSERYLAFVADLIDRSNTLHPLSTTRGAEAPALRLATGAVAAAAPGVPVGNDATDQRQLDSIATLLDAIIVHVRCGGRVSRQIWPLVEHFAQRLVDAPFEPTSGVWELPEPRLLVTEELARWIGLDIALRVRRLLRPWCRRPEWRRARDAARRAIEAVEDPATGLLPQTFDGPAVPDAAALLACIHGFYGRDRAHARRVARATVDALSEDVFLRRYPAGSDGLPGHEGAFIPASWWAVSALAMTGFIDEATERADAMCAQLPSLVAEEWHVEERRPAGNIPLLWSHTEMARALLNLDVARMRQRYGRGGIMLHDLALYVRVHLSRRS